MSDVHSVRKVAISCQCAKLLIFKESSARSVMIKKNQVLAWKERKKCLENIDRCPDIVAIKEV